MTSAALIAVLAGRGIRLSANGDKLRVEGPADLLTGDVYAVLVKRKPELMAVLTGKPAPSSIPGIVWDSRGGVRVADPPDLRTACMDAARRRGFPRIAPKLRPSDSVGPGEAAWAAFAAGALLGDVAEAGPTLEDMP